MKRSRLIAIACATALLASTALAAVAVHAGPVTRAQYVARAEKICAASKKASNKLVSAANKKTKQGDLKAGGAKVVEAAGVFGKGVRAVGAVKRPGADKALLGRWVKSLRVDVVLFEQLGAALASGDAHKLTVATNVAARHAKRTNAIVAGFGFNFCLINR